MSDKVLKWGILGTSEHAHDFTIPALNKAYNAVPYAIAGRKPEKVKEFQELFGIEKGYNDLDELIADPEIDCVYIPLPNNMHHDYAIKAMEAGKNVMTEKPISWDAASAQEMFDCAKKNGVVFEEGFAYLHSPIYPAIKKDLDSGIIGEPKFIESAYEIVEPPASNIRMNNDTYGGSIYDVGCYSTSLTLFMFDGYPNDIQGLVEYTKEDIDIHADVVMKYEDGRYSTYNCGMCLPDTGNYKEIDRLIIVGTAGYIRYFFKFNEEGDLIYYIENEDGDQIAKRVHCPDPYQLEFEQFGRCVTDGETPYISEEFSMKNIKMMEETLQKVGYYDRHR